MFYAFNNVGLPFWRSKLSIMEKNLIHPTFFPKFKPQINNTIANKQQTSTNENSQYPQVGSLSSQKPT